MLEQRVAERTAELAATNQHLEQEQAALHQANAQLQHQREVADNLREIGGSR